MARADSTDPAVIRAERDLYRSLLDLGEHDDVASFLDEALLRVRDAVGAQRGYLSLEPHASCNDGDTVPTLYSRCGFAPDELDAVRSQMSTGIVALAMRTGKTVSTASALDDPRFRSQSSVKAAKIQAVVCAPIGAEHAVGALYLQGRSRPGPFDESEVALIEAFADRIAPLARRMARAAAMAATEDATVEVRRRVASAAVVGRSSAIAETLRQVGVAAGVDVPVLLTGESGTGKTLVARAIHDSSRRAAGPFIEVNCAAIPEQLFEAEVFGAEKGAHSTATRRMPGKVAAAQGGTLLLDEIGDLPLALQAKLLQFLQSRRYFALGSDRAAEADVRVIAATNADLADAVAGRRFREDLYYRLDVLSIRVPALRERRDDIVPIARAAAASMKAGDREGWTLSFAAERALALTEWPGNVRQLVAAVQRGAAFASSENASEIDVGHVFAQRKPAAVDAAIAAGSAGRSITWQEANREFQSEFLAKVYAECSGNVSEVARRLEMSRSHLHELLRAHGVGRSRGQ